MSETPTAENDVGYKRPLPEGVFPEIAAQYETHDPTCISIPEFWLGRKGGVSCPSDLWDCTDCEVTFYIEGLAWLNHETPDEDEIHVCGCCALKRGVTLYRARFGVSTSPPPPPQPPMRFVRVPVRPRRVIPPGETRP